jgi:hypothetical protein
LGLTLLPDTLVAQQKVYLKDARTFYQPVRLSDNEQVEIYNTSTITLSPGFEVKATTGTAITFS